MAYDIGLKVGVDGESDYKRALRDINADLKTTATEMKLVTSEFDANDKSMKALSSRGEVLSKQIDTQKDKIKLLSDAMENAKIRYGENSDQVRKWEQQLNTAKAELNTLTREFDQNSKALVDVQRGYNDAGQKLDEFGNVVENVGDETEKTSGKMQKFGKAAEASAAIAAAAVAALAAGVVKLGKELAQTSVNGAKYADDVLTTATVTGLAADKLQEYMYAAELVDVSVDTLTGTMRRNINAMKQAQAGSKTYADAFAKLRISVTSSNGQLRDSEEVYFELIDALGAVTNETERDAIAMTLLGKSAQDLNPLIAAGSERMAELAKQAHDAGYVLSEETLNAYGAFDDKLRELENGATAAKNALGTALLPALTELSTDGVEMLSKFTKAVKDANGDLPTMIDNIGRLLPEAADRLAEYVPGAVELIGKALQAAVGGISDNLDPFLDVASDLVVSILSQTAELLPGLISSIGDLAVDLVKGIFDSNVIGGIASAAISAIGKLIAQIIEAFPGILKGLESFFSTSAPQIFSALLGAVKIIVESLSKNAPAIIRELSPLVESIIRFVIEAVGDLLPILSDLVGEITADLIPSVIEAIAKAVPDIIAGLIAALFENIPQLITGFIELAVRVVFQAIPSLLLAIVDIIPTLIDGIVSAFNSENGEKFKRVGKAWAGQFSEGIREAINSLWENIKQDFYNQIINSAWFKWALEFINKTKIGRWTFDVANDALEGLGILEKPSNVASSGVIGGSSSVENLLSEQNKLLEKIADKDTTLVIGDDQIGSANDRYNDERGVRVSDSYT